MAADSESCSNVGFLFRTMIERDPKKRRVKPVESHMLQLDFGGLDDSEDDSDFSIGDHKDQEDVSVSGSNVSSSESEDSESNTEPKESLKNDRHASKSAGDLIEIAKQKQAQARQRISLTADNKFHVKICCICLGDISEEEDEIVECDNCGISVHEGCYGISDCDSITSTVSSSSTEPWFCDACKAGKTNLICELCPNLGGIFKETDIGRWVHLVCALYIPGVAFGEVDKLSPVTLFEMPYNKWGSKVCCLCEDDRFSRTGVCISCDAGMCRMYFHVTCAQREGLLSEASQEEEIADPFFAYCKLHAEKVTVKFKKNNWLALQSQTKQKKDENMIKSEEQLRIVRKLEHHRQKYKNNKKKATQPWVPTQKIPRLLTSSPAACQKLIRKAELMGINNQSLHIPLDGKMLDIRRKWHIPPAFNIDFVCYYLDRNDRMVSMKKKLDELLIQNNLLQSEEKDIRQQYEQIAAECQEFRSENTRLKQKGIELYNLVKTLSKKKIKVPEIFVPKRIINQNAKSPTKTGRKSCIGQLIMQCGTCEESHDQHQMAKCDTCQLHYHLSCLDPPLTRMPKKTKLQGWQCSECDKSEEGCETDSTSLDPDAPRSLRRHPKPPAKYFRSASTESIPKTQKKRSKGPDQEQQAKSKPKKLKASTEKNEAPPPALSSRPTRSCRRSQLSSSESSRSDCFKCGESGDNSSVIRCDNCEICYHFQCSDPPVKKSHKKQGQQTWTCAQCKD